MSYIREVWNEIYNAGNKSHCDINITSLNLKTDNYNYNLGYQPKSKQILFKTDFNFNVPKFDNINFSKSKGQTVLFVEYKYLDNFLSLIEDIYENTKKEKKLNDIKIKIFNIFLKWKKFFSVQSSNLSVTLQIGLIGELITLKDIILAEGEVCVENWKGPEKKHQDFNMLDQLIEVKTHGQEDKITINGVEQLYTETEKDIYIHVHKITPSLNGLTLLDYIEEVISLIKSDKILEMFYEKLQKVGYHPRSEYSEKYIREYTVIYKVDDGFPRVPKIDGISDVHYKINLNDITTYIVGGSH